MTAPLRARLASVALVVPLSVSAMLVARPAQAADPEAQVLFDEGKRLLARGDIAMACERFARSQRIEPAGGTLLHLARCNEDLGKTATAWTLFNEALSTARTQGRKDREQVATEHLELLAPRLMRLRIVVKAAAAIPELAVLRDGKPVDAAGWGVAVPVDPGVHTIEASAPGRRPYATKIELAKEGSVVELAVPMLEKQDGAASNAPPRPTRAPDAPSVDTPLSTQHMVALVAGGVGIVGLGLGTYFGLSASSAHNETDRLCGGPAPSPCPQSGVDSANDAQTLGTLSTISIVAGAVVLAGGLVLWFTAPRSGVTSSLLRRGLLVSF